MTPGTVAAWVVSALTLLVACITVWALWMNPQPGRHRGRGPASPLQLPGLPPMTEAEVDGEHDWDGFLWALTVAEPKPTLREESIELPREGEPL